MKFTINSDSITGALGYGELAISPNEANGYRPFELFVSSLVGCSGSLLRTILSKRKVSYQTLQIEVFSVRNPDQVNRIDHLSFIANVQSADPFSPQVAEKVSQLVVKNCGMIQSVIQSIDITFTIKWIPLNGDSD